MTIWCVWQLGLISQVVYAVDSSVHKWFQYTSKEMKTFAASYSLPYNILTIEYV